MGSRPSCVVARGFCFLHVALSQGSGVARHLGESAQVIALNLGLLAVELAEQVVGEGAEGILVVGHQVLHAVIYKFVQLEQQVGFISQEFSRKVLVAVRIEDIAVAHRCEDGAHEVLEPLVDQCFDLLVELDGPLARGEVVGEILIDFLFNQKPSLQQPLVD